MKDSDRIVVPPARMLTQATATNDPCNSLVCIKTNTFNPSRASWCSSTPLAGCKASELKRDAATEMRKSHDHTGWERKKPKDEQHNVSRMI